MERVQQNVKAVFPRLKKIYRHPVFWVCAVLGGLLLYIWSIWPMTTVMSPSLIIWRLNGSIPLSQPKTEWEKRGEYVVTVSGCGMCHTIFYWAGPDNFKAYAGGMRVRWKNALQERVAQNLTPEKETGIGAWSEEDFIVAMKSGITPNSKTAHWQAMPWDMHANWSLDDLRAMYRYLMSLEPKKRKPSHPVKGPLPDTDTFYFGS